MKGGTAPNEGSRDSDSGLVVGFGVCDTPFLRPLVTLELAVCQQRLERVSARQDGRGEHWENGCLVGSGYGSPDPTRPTDTVAPAYTHSPLRSSWQALLHITCLSTHTYTHTVPHGPEHTHTHMEGHHTCSWAYTHPSLTLVKYTTR